MDLGIALAPESRRDQGLCLNLPIGLNINLPVYGAPEPRPHRSAQNWKLATPTSRSTT